MTEEQYSPSELDVASTPTMALPVTRQPDRPLITRDKDAATYHPEGLIKTATDMRVVEVSDALAPAYAKASTLELCDAEVAALMAPFPDSAVDIRPHDGLIFLSHINISDRLNAVFKPGKWALLCRRHWLEGGTLYGEYILLIRGVMVGESVGGHLYQPNNPKTNYSDSLESTAAEALRRIAGKRLSCGSQVWHKDYAEKWVAANAEQVGGKWRKKSSLQSTNDRVAQSSHPRSPTVAPKPAVPAVPMTPEARKFLLMAKLRGYETAATAIFIEEGIVLPTETYADIGVTTVERMPPDAMVALIKQVKARKEEWDQIPGAEVSEPKYSDKAGPEGHPDEVPEAGVADPVGTLTSVTEKGGTGKNGKPFVKFGFKIDGAWFSSFSATLFDAAQKLVDQRVRYTFSESKFGKDLLTIESAEENQP